MNLLYLVFGSNVKNHFQANFSILSFLRYQAQLTGITIVTDAPDFYQHLAGRVTVLPVTEATLKEWKGEFDFFWRIKIKALEHVARQHPTVPLLYLDSDTFLHGSLAQVTGPLAAGRALMHEAEGALAALRSKTDKRMWGQIRGRSFGGVRITEQHQMWNAGVVGIPAARNLEAIELALRICDDFSRAGVTPRLIEQFALSVALTEVHGLAPADVAIGHYWSNKDAWNEQLATFFIESMLKSRTVDEEVQALATFDFNCLPVKYRRKMTQVRLEKLVRKLFPPLEVAYADRAGAGPSQS